MWFLPFVVTIFLTPQGQQQTWMIYNTNNICYIIIISLSIDINS